MQSGRGRARVSPSMRQSIVGLMILLSLGFLGGFVLWLNNFKLRERSYEATIMFANAGGMTPGTKVSFRGIQVGQVLAVDPRPEGAAVRVEIAPADRLIPRDSLIEAIQAGLVGETSIDITPIEPVSLKDISAPPLDPECDPTQIICDGSLLEGGERLDVNALIRSTLRISKALEDPNTIELVESIAQNTSSALANLSALSKESAGLIKDVKDSGSLQTLNSTLLSLNKTANNLNELSQETAGLMKDVRQSGSIDTLNSTLTSMGEAAEQLRVFMVVNQDRVAVTLTNIEQTSTQLRKTLSSLDPVLSEVDGGELLTNLEAMSADAAALTRNLRNLSTGLNDSTTLVTVQELLDSARTVFQNLQKITSDMDEITGDPKLRNDLMRLIQGLSDLVSSTEQLQQQLEYAQKLDRLAAEVAQARSKSNPAPIPSSPEKDDKDRK